MATDGEEGGGRNPPPDRYIHSDIWDKLVSEPNDVWGFVAYGIYQQQKREWIKFCQSRDNCLPSEQAVKDYSFCHQDGAIQGLKAQAQSLLLSFAEGYAEDQKDRFTSTAVNEILSQNISTFTAETVEFKRITLDQLEKVKSDVGSVRSFVGHRTGYTHHILTHIVGFLAIAGVIAVVTIAANFDEGPKQFFERTYKFFTGHEPGK